MTALAIIALCVSIFGAYAYGSAVILSLRHRRTVWSRVPSAPAPSVHIQSLAMFIACTLWFVLHTIIGFRGLLGSPPNDDWFDLAALELVFAFPGLIFHTVLVESRTDCPSGEPNPFGAGILAVLTLAAPVEH